MQMMNWDDLRVFLAIADTGSLSGAAKALSNNHSTIYRRLNALEDEMKVRMFDRRATGYALTPAGERMLQLARDADNAIHNIERELAGRDVSPSGVVRVTTPPNIARTIVPAAVRALRKSHPGILVEVSVGDSDYDLNRREADLALRATTNPPEHLVGRRVAELSWWFFGSKNEKRKQPARAEEIKGKPLIGADASLMRLKAFRWLDDHYRDDIVARANDLSTMAALAGAGVGYALLPSDQACREVQRLFEITEFGGALWLLTHPDLHEVRRIKIVSDALAQAVKEAKISAI
jgi:DNA-binding transcriptional LysR family regulator